MIESADPQFVRLADGVWAALRAGGGWFVSNAGFVEGPGHLVVVDAFASERHTRMLQAGIQERRTHANTPSSIVLTHEHGDHVNGAYLFEQAGSEVLAAPVTIDELTGHGIRLWPGLLEPPDWGAVQPPQQLTPVTGPVHVPLGRDRDATVIPAPTTAHTAADLVVWVAGAGVLFTGDLVFSQVTPLALHGSLHGWLDALDWLDGFKARVVVPGHGPLGDARITQPVRDYLHWCLTGAEELQRGRTLDDVVAERPEQWANWAAPERDAVNLLRARAEVESSFAFQPAVALSEMLRRAGGPVRLAN